MERWYPNLHLEDKVVAEGKGSDTGISTVEEGENQDMKDREEITHTARPKRERRKPAWMCIGNGGDAGDHPLICKRCGVFVFELSRCRRPSYLSPTTGSARRRGRERPEKA
nr:hypothetical protein Iba_chr12cCG13060 [Ipomoea batatas]GME02044.1 hypothetical protein Iba_contig3585CG0010 [Ipomoea batatas]